MRKWLALAAIAATTAICAQALAQDAEAAREKLMKEMGGAARTLTQMSKGQAPYDAAAATAAFTTLRDHAAGIPATFKDPTPAGTKTEASPKIWEDMAGFTAKAKALEDDAAAGIQVAANGADAIGAALGKVGQDCQACHQVFRVKQ
jgi:cytochrome c556